MSEPIEVVLGAPRGAWRVGETVTVEVAVKNVSPHVIWMVGVVDGSEWGYRYPHYRPSIVAGHPVPAVEHEACGNVAPLQLADFVRLEPGESFDPTVPRGAAAFVTLATFAGFTPSSPGDYDSRLTISTRGDRDEDWLGMTGYPGEEAVKRRLHEVPRLEVQSNRLTVRVQ